MTIQDLHKIRWESFGYTYNPDTGIARFWRQNPTLGGCLSNEVPLDDYPTAGTVGQAFAGGIVIWDPIHDAYLFR